MSDCFKRFEAKKNEIGSMIGASKLVTPQYLNKRLATDSCSDFYSLFISATKY